MTTVDPGLYRDSPHGSSLPEIATRREVAAYTRMSVPTLARWAMEGKGPKFRRAGGRVIYMRADVIAWLDSLSGA